MALKWGISFPDVLLKGQQKKNKFGLLGNRRSSSSLIHKKTPRGSFLSSSGETMLKAQPATVFLQISLFHSINSISIRPALHPPNKKWMYIYIYSSYHWKTYPSSLKINSSALPCCKGVKPLSRRFIALSNHRLASGPVSPLFNTESLDVWKIPEHLKFLLKKMANLRINLLSARCPKFFETYPSQRWMFSPMKKKQTEWLDEFIIDVIRIIFL